MIHYYVLRFVQTSDGRLVAAEREEKMTGIAAVSSACAYATEKGGAIAFSRQGDRGSAGAQRCRIIAGLGLLPNDVEHYLNGLSELARPEA
ncbi:MAG: hypothetical protein JOY67_13270 [Hyphomicrobiales bacterium]|nr:hypothetical protein [Hyphomicrobiales bacterium]MBV9113782.1 hypothetical protein [Hyphomicrobiales bacterium]MBV9518486.1 hypothetical protein [Hyphomicrobiales bacterium]